MPRKRIQIAEAADLLGVSPRMVQKLCARGDLAAIKVGSIWTTTPADIDAYLARQRAAEKARHQAAQQPFICVPVQPPRPPAPDDVRQRFHQLIHGDRKQPWKQR